MSGEKITLEDFMTAAGDQAVARSRRLLGAASVFDRRRQHPEKAMFSNEVAWQLRRGYRNLVAPRWGSLLIALNGEARNFVDSLDRLAADLASVPMPLKQEDRRDMLRQIARGLQLQKDGTGGLDSGALMHAHQCIERQKSGERAPNTADVLVVFERAAEFADRAQNLGPEIDGWLEAADSLPVFAEDEKPRLRMGLRLERLFYDHSLEFDLSDVGFPADCFNAIWDAANPGKAKERAKEGSQHRANYFLQKIVKHPESMAQMIARQRKKGP